MLGIEPRDRGVVASFGQQILAVFGDRGEGIVVDLAAAMMGSAGSSRVVSARRILDFA